MRNGFVVLLLFSCFVLTACDSLSSQNSENELRHSVNEFMQAQVDGDWEKAYSYYDDDSQKRIAKADYLTQPRKLTYKNFRIEDVDLKSNEKAEVDVKIDISFQGNDFKNAPQKQEWIQKNGKWRVHLEQVTP